MKDALAALRGIATTTYHMGTGSEGAPLSLAILTRLIAEVQPTVIYCAPAIIGRLIDVRGAIGNKSASMWGTLELQTLAIPMVGSTLKSSERVVEGQYVASTGGTTSSMFLVRELTKDNGKELVAVGVIDGILDASPVW